MFRTALLVLALSFFGGPEKPQGIREHPFRVAGLNGLTGHGCPVETPSGGVLLLTARHIVDSGDDSPTQTGLRWSDGEGGGVAGHVRVSGVVDLAVLSFPLGQTPGRVYKIAPNPPKVGDKVYIWGMNYEKNKPWEDSFVETEVIAVRAGIVISKKSPGPGSSGSCAFNSEGEVIGIKVAVMPRNGELVEGIIVGLFQPYVTLPEEQQ